MSQRPVKDVLTRAERHEGQEGYYYTEPLPNADSSLLNPFLLLHHHGPVRMPPRNFGLPFGPHPHRGFETATFVVKGSLVHRDSHGFSSEIHGGGVQWMTAGRGLIHNEFASKKFMREGGDLEMIQLWINLPNDLRMSKPAYTGLQEADVVHAHPGEGVDVHVYSGEVAGVKGAMKTLTDVSSALIGMKAGSSLSLPVRESDAVLFYVLSGKLRVNGREAGARGLVVFEAAPGGIAIEAAEDATLLFGSARHLDEKYVWQGPFVVEDQSRLLEAMRDYQMGKMGFYAE